MKTVNLLLLLLIFVCFSCSKSEEAIEKPPAKEGPASPDDTWDNPSALSGKNKALRDALLGTWKLVKEYSDMGPVNRSSFYRRTLTFDSTLSYTDSTLYLDYPASNKIVTLKYTVEIKEPTGPGYNPYIFLNPNDKIRFPGLGVFRGSQNDTLFIFNGLGSEYYTKSF